MSTLRGVTKPPINKCPQSIMGLLAQVENGDKPFRKQKFHAANEKAWRV